MHLSPCRDALFARVVLRDEPRVDRGIDAARAPSPTHSLGGGDARQVCQASRTLTRVALARAFAAHHRSAAARAARRTRVAPAAKRRREARLGPRALERARSVLAGKACRNARAVRVA